jgi:hypothetical protein
MLLHAPGMGAVTRAPSVSQPSWERYREIHGGGYAAGCSGSCPPRWLWAARTRPAPCRQGTRLRLGPLLGVAHAALRALARAGEAGLRRPGSGARLLLCYRRRISRNSRPSGPAPGESPAGERNAKSGKSPQRSRAVDAGKARNPQLLTVHGSQCYGIGRYGPPRSRSPVEPLSMLSAASGELIARLAAAHFPT